MSELKEIGQLEVILGPMYSGKTSELIRRIQRYHLANYRCIIVKHSEEINMISSTTITSHDGHSLPAIRASNLNEIEDIIINFDVVGIDEGHLFADLAHFCEMESDGGKKVIVAALDSCENKVFNEVLALIPISESVTKFTAICMACSNEATFTMPYIDDEQVGRKQKKFMSLCGTCYHYNHKNCSWRSPFKKYLFSEDSSD